MSPEIEMVLQKMQKAVAEDNYRDFDALLFEMVQTCTGELKKVLFPMPDALIPFAIFSLEAVLEATRQLDHEAVAAVEDLRKSFSFMIISGRKAAN